MRGLLTILIILAGLLISNLVWAQNTVGDARSLMDRCKDHMYAIAGTSPQQDPVEQLPGGHVYERGVDELQRAEDLAWSWNPLDAFEARRIAKGILTGNDTTILPSDCEGVVAVPTDGDSH